MSMLNDVVKDVKALSALEYAAAISPSKKLKATTIPKCLFAKIGNKAFKDIFIYDYYWRLLRNYKIRSIQDITVTGVNEETILPVIHHMLALQKNMPLTILKMGMISKTLMFFNYLLKPNH